MTFMEEIVSKVNIVFEIICSKVVCHFTKCFAYLINNVCYNRIIINKPDSIKPCLFLIGSIKENLHLHLSGVDGIGTPNAPLKERRCAVLIIISGQTSRRVYL